MPIFTVRTPDGSQVDIRADTEADAIRGAQEWYASVNDQRPKAPDPNASQGELKFRDGRTQTIDKMDPRMQAYSARYNAGQIDRSAPVGSITNPYVAQDAEAEKAVGAGEWYIGLDGKLRPGGGGLHNAMIQVDSGVRGAADMLSFGFADEAAAGANAITGGLIQGRRGGTIGDRYRGNLKDERARDAADRRDRGLARTTGQVAAVAATVAAPPFARVPRVLPNAGPAVRAAETVGRNVMAGGLQGGLAGAGNAEPGKRLEGMAKGAMAGAATGGALTPVIAGGSRLARAVAPAPAGQKAINAMARGNVDDLRARAEALRRLDANPALVDVTDEQGRAILRAGASRNTPARESVVRFAKGRALNLPDRMSTQARRVMSSDPRTPGEIRSAATEARSDRAAAAYGAVRGQTVPMAPETIQALRTDIGRSAIREAAMRERDPDVRAALNRLADGALDNPNGTTYTVGMADRVQRVLQSKAQAALRAGDNDLATTYGQLSRSVRDPVRAQVPGYDAAMRQYGEDSGMVNAATIGEELLKRNTDEFVTAARGLSEAERPLALAAGRRAIERAAGDGTGAAPGVARRIAQAPEQQARTRALLGETAAADLEARMAAEADAVQNARFISPNTGSQTATRTADQQVADQFIEAAGAARGGIPGIVGYAATAAANRLKTLGMNDADVQQLLEIAIDPNRLDEALAIMDRFTNRPEGLQIIRALRDNAAKAAGEGSVR